MTTKSEVKDEQTQPKWIEKYSVKAFMALMSINLFMLLIQPILIGQFLDGRSEWLKHHYDTGIGIMAVGTLLLIASVFTWWFARWPIAVIPIVLVVVSLEGYQLSTGLDRNMGIHIPLGVFLIGIFFGLMKWARKQPVGPQRSFRSS